MCIFHKFGYFISKSTHWDEVTIWRQCYHCRKSQWWKRISGEWSALEKRELPMEQQS